jgi:TRAP transporter TAXI family solute receptor
MFRGKTGLKAKEESIMQTAYRQMGAILLALLGFIWSAAPAVCGETTFVTIGTGGLTGVYFPTGGAIAKIVNQNHQKNGIRISVEATEGSSFNVEAVVAGDMDFGIVQSDTQYKAVHGQGEWKVKGARKALKAVFSIYTEAVTLLAAEDAGIMKLADLRGKRVNIGGEGSGFRQNAIDALSINGIDPAKDLITVAVSASEAPELLADGSIDAFFYTVGHPTGLFKLATATGRKSRFLSIPNVDPLIAKYPCYVKARIYKRDYPNALNADDIDTFGVKATLVTSESMKEAVVYTVTKTIFENLEAFKQLHPALADLNKAEMLTALSAPIHAGALKYYKEAGLR